MDVTIQGVPPPAESEEERREREERALYEDLKGAVQGRYELREKLGGGGMGVVWEAVDEGRLKRRVAIKGLRPSRDVSGVPEKRLTAEVIAMARVRHPNVVTVYGFDGGPQIGGGFVPYHVVMELLDGPDLSTYLMTSDQAFTRVSLPGVAEPTVYSALSVGRAIELVQGIVDGVGAAHAQGILHRDLKPDNVLLHSAGAGQPIPVVTDFGLAQLHMPPPSVEGQTLIDMPPTMTGQHYGTPPYISPEVWRGQPVTAASDLYAVGCILYELLTGFAPGEDFLLRRGAGLDNFQSWMALRIEGIPATPVTRYRSDIGPWIDTFMETALALDPAHRFKTAKEFRDALAYHLDHERAHDATEKLPVVDVVDQRFWRGFAAAVVVLLCLLAGGLGFIAGRRSRPPVAPSAVSRAPVAVVAPLVDAGSPVVVPMPIPVDGSVPAPDVPVPSDTASVPVDAGRSSQDAGERRRGHHRPACGSISRRTGLMVTCVDQ